MTFEIDEEQRQLLLLAIAELSLRRPGWELALRQVALHHLGGAKAEAMYDRFRRTSAEPPMFEPGLLSAEQRHQVLDMLMACWATAQANPRNRLPGESPRLYSQASILDLASWSHDQVMVEQIERKVVP